MHERSTAKIKDLKPAPYNPRRIDEKALDGLKGSIRRFGLVQEIVVNRRSMTIVGGHQRVKAAMDAGLAEVPVVYVDLDDGEEAVLNVTLNNPEIQGSFTDGVDGLLESIDVDDDLFSDVGLDLLIGKEDDAPHLDEEHVDLTSVPYRRVNVLVSVPIDMWDGEIVELFSRIREMDGVEYDQNAN